MEYSLLRVIVLFAYSLVVYLYAAAPLDSEFMLLAVIFTTLAVLITALAKILPAKLVLKLMP